MSHTCTPPPLPPPTHTHTHTHTILLLVKYNLMTLSSPVCHSYMSSNFWHSNYTFSFVKFVPFGFLHYRDSTNKLAWHCVSVCSEPLTSEMIYSCYLPIASDKQCVHLSITCPLTPTQLADTRIHTHTRHRWKRKIQKLFKLLVQTHKTWQHAVIMWEYFPSFTSATNWFPFITRGKRMKVFTSRMRLKSLSAGFPSVPRLTEMLCFHSAHQK